VLLGHGKKDGYKELLYDTYILQSLRCILDSLQLLAETHFLLVSISLGIILIIQYQGFTIFRVLFRQWRASNSRNLTRNNNNYSF